MVRRDSVPDLSAFHHVGEPPARNPAYSAATAREEGVVSEELKRQLVAAHRQVFDGLLDAVQGLGPDGWATPTGCPGWSVHDQLAHVITIERAMLGDPPDDVEVPDLPHVRNEFGRIVEVGVEARRGRSAAELVAEAEGTFDRRIAALEALDPAALQQPMDGLAGMRAKGSQMLRTRIYDMVTHEQDVRRALDRPGGTEGPHVDISVEQIVRAWARTLPTRVEETGVLEVAVAGRSPVRVDLAAGALHRDGDGPDPTGTLHLGVSDLIALAGGRTDAPDPAELTLEGDTGWVVRVLEHATITP